MIQNLLLGAVTATLLLTTNVSATHYDNCVLKSGESIAQYRLVPRIVDAVSKVGISARQTKQVADGIKSYRATMAEIKTMQIFPVDSFMEDDFNEKKFIKEMSEKHLAKIAAKAALFKYIFAVLTPEQKKIFKRSYAAPMIESMIKASY